jgi:hypothetical protein
MSPSVKLDNVVVEINKVEGDEYPFNNILISEFKFTPKKKERDMKVCPSYIVNTRKKN